MEHFSVSSYMQDLKKQFSLLANCVDTDTIRRCTVEYNTFLVYCLQLERGNITQLLIKQS